MPTRSHFRRKYSSHADVDELFDYSVTTSTTGSTGTVHTSTKARLTSVAISVALSVVGRWSNDVVVAVAMFASVCPALQRPYLPIVTNPENNLCVQMVIWIATKI